MSAEGPVVLEVPQRNHAFMQDGGFGVPEMAYGNLALKLRTDTSSSFDESERFDPDTALAEASVESGLASVTFLDERRARRRSLTDEVVAEEVDTNTAQDTAEEVVVPKSAVLQIGEKALKAADVVQMGEMAGEAGTQARSRHFLGKVAVAQNMGQNGEGQKEKHRSSLDVLYSAAAGSQKAFKALLADTKPHVYEIFGGVGEGMTVEMDVDETGNTVWDDQTPEDRLWQTLITYQNQSRAVREGVLAEGLTSFRLVDRNQEGQLSNKIVMEFSAMAEASQKELSEWGFFLNTIACSIRGTRFVNGKCLMTSVFVAGVDQRKVQPQPSETEAQEAHRQEQALQLRFDIRVLRDMYALFGVKGADKMSPAELLGTPLVLPDDYDVIDMVMLYDQLASKEMDDEAKTFFGSAELWQKLGSPDTLTREHYDRHMEEREARQQKYEKLCEDIVHTQIRRHKEATTPREAVELKRRVVLDMTVERAVEDTSIDEGRFGRKSADHIVKARIRYAQGDTLGARRETNEAKKTASDPGCPTGDNSTKTAGEEGTELSGELERIPKNIRCIKCGEYSPKEEVVHKDYWCCPKCKYSVDVCTGEELHASEPPKANKPTHGQGGQVIRLFEHSIASEGKAAA